MNKVTLFTLFILAILHTNAQSNTNKNRRHRIQHTETHVSDYKDPENSRIVIEKNDRKGRVIEKIILDTNNRKQERFVYEYEKNSKSILKFNAKDTLIHRTNWKYDYKHRVVKYEEIKIQKNQSESIVTSYNKWGEKESENFYKNLVLIKVRSYQYNDEGLPILQITKDANGKILYEKSIQYNP